MSYAATFSGHRMASNATAQSFVPPAGCSPLPKRARIARKLKTSTVRRASHKVRAAQASTAEQSPIVKFAENIGLPVGEGLFGFTPFAEVWVGRLAMMGFITSIVEETITGKGTLGQIGFETPSYALAAGVVGIAAGLTLAATFNTVLRVTGGKMSPQQADRYRSFLGLKKEAAAIKEQQKEMKSEWKEGKGDFTAPLNLTAVEQAAREPKAVDEFLNVRDGKQVEEAAAELKGRSTAQPQTGMSQPPAAAMSEWDYARMVELNQGRLAMLGFLAAVGVEAFTGYGILGQLVMYAKWAGLLGPMSGF